VIGRLLLGELEPVRRGDDHDALLGTDQLAVDQLAEDGQRHAGVRVVEHAGAIGERRLVGQLGFAGLLDDAVELLQGAHGALVAHRIADLDGARQRLPGLHRLEALEVREVRAVERIGVLRLRHGDARQLLDEAELAHEEEAPAEGADVAEVAAGDDHPVGHLPVELLHQLDGDGLLALDAQAVHRVGEIDGALLGDLLHQRHAAVEIGVEAQHQGAVGERLYQLSRRDLVARQQDDGGNTGGGAVVGQGGGGITGRGAGDGSDLLALGDHLLDDRDQHGHAEVLERPGVRVAALLDPQVLDPAHAPVAFRPQEVGAALVGGHDVLVGQEGDHPLLLAPHPGAVGEVVAPVALVEELHPRRRRAPAQRVHVVHHVEQVAARRAAVDDLEQAEARGTAVDAFEPGAVFTHLAFLVHRDVTCPVSRSAMVMSIGPAPNLVESPPGSSFLMRLASEDWRYLQAHPLCVCASVSKIRIVSSHRLDRRQNLQSSRSGPAAHPDWVEILLSDQGQAEADAVSAPRRARRWSR
jgi:hypothetical protein